MSIKVGQVKWYTDLEHQERSGLRPWRGQMMGVQLEEWLTLQHQGRTWILLQQQHVVSTLCKKHCQYPRLVTFTYQHVNLSLVVVANHMKTFVRFQCFGISQLLLHFISDWVGEEKQLLVVWSWPGHHFTKIKSLRKTHLKTKYVVKFLFLKMQISVAILPRTLFPWHTSDNVLLVLHGVDSLQIFKISVKV